MRTMQVALTKQGQTALKKLQRRTKRPDADIVNAALQVLLYNLPEESHPTPNTANVILDLLQLSLPLPLLQQRTQKEMEH